MNPQKPTHPSSDKGNAPLESTARQQLTTDVANLPSLAVKHLRFVTPAAPLETNQRTGGAASGSEPRPLHEKSIARTVAVTSASCAESTEVTVRELALALTASTDHADGSPKTEGARKAGPVPKKRPREPDESTRDGFAVPRQRSKHQRRGTGPCSSSRPSSAVPTTIPPSPKDAPPYPLLLGGNPDPYVPPGSPSMKPFLTSTRSLWTSLRPLEECPREVPFEMIQRMAEDMSDGRPEDAEDDDSALEGDTKKEERSRKKKNKAYKTHVKRPPKSYSSTKAMKKMREHNTVSANFKRPFAKRNPNFVHRNKR